MPPAIEYAEGVTPAVADFIMVQAGASISVDEVYKKLVLDLNNHTLPFTILNHRKRDSKPL